MFEKIRAVLNQFSTSRHKDSVEKLLQKIWAFLGKVKKVYYLKFL